MAFLMLSVILLSMLIDVFLWFWMENLHKKIQLMLEFEFLKGPFFILHFSYYALMTFLMLSVILLSMLRLLLEVLDGKSSQENSVNAGAPQGPILHSALFLLHINDLPDVICNIAIYADDTTLYSKSDQASDLGNN